MVQGGYVTYKALPSNHSLWSAKSPTALYLVNVPPMFMFHLSNKELFAISLYWVTFFFTAFNLHIQDKPATWEIIPMIKRFASFPKKVGICLNCTKTYTVLKCPGTVSSMMNHRAVGCSDVSRDHIDLFSTNPFFQSEKCPAICSFWFSLDNPNPNALYYGPCWLNIICWIIVMP